MYYQAGKLSTCGSALRKDFRPTVTATVIERLAAAGAYVFGGLNMAEFGLVSLCISFQKKYWLLT